MEKLEREIAKMVSELKKRESTQDRLIRQTRELVRECSLSVKHVHGGNMGGAESHLRKATALLVKIRKSEDGFRSLVSQSYQEYAEMSALISVVKRRPLKTHTELGIPFPPFMTGLFDCIGELRRQMLEELRHGREDEAAYYFEKMNAMYEATLPLRFSNSILPNFRRKQDVARAQVENARSELLRSR